ncbi:hypothetical protein B0H63DRAFT_455502 [Podospora didyma]|uniref:CBM-cenC domain-containing protein n=1 Tax=Podospora didyma TaxID=330526 RepID=A0AAE0K304_9PEZI|nr:hypothetical protein B0H63DRAFT_455502 [Podospora didyma]
MWRWQPSQRLQQYAYVPPGLASLVGATYLGCFVDGGNPRILPDNLIAADDMTVVKCQGHYTGAGFQYFSVEYGRECWHLLLSALSLAGSGKEICGAGSRINVWGTGAVDLSLSLAPFSSPSSPLPSLLSDCSESSMCFSLINTPSTPWPAITPIATQCRNAFNAPTTIPAAVISCFASANAPTLNGASAYGCTQNAGQICATATVCAETLAPAAPTNAVTNGSFESGVLTPWLLWSASGSDATLRTSIVTGEVSYGGRYALKAAYNNGANTLRPWMQIISGLQPGATYKVEYYCFRLLNNGGTTFLLESSLFNRPAGVWTRVPTTFVPNASFAQILFTINANVGGGPNIVYVDNITIIKA